MIGHVIGEDYISFIIKKKKHVRKKDGSNIKKKIISPKRSIETEKPCSKEFIVATADRRFCIKGSTAEL